MNRVDPVPESEWQFHSDLPHARPLKSGKDGEDSMNLWRHCFEALRYGDVSFVSSLWRLDAVDVGDAVPGRVGAGQVGAVLLISARPWANASRDHGIDIGGAGGSCRVPLRQAEPQDDLPHLRSMAGDRHPAFGEAEFREALNLRASHDPHGIRIGYAAAAGSAKVFAAPFVACSLLHFWYDSFVWSVRKRQV
ncbi:hypothetical protein G4G27_01395 [Sphingomonas sp. So64.6b]|uniref:hypothetical protein n=1 Tax=Sphingomonas sp. So64.6b TaxID=2997354 RepID=UPI001601A23B|nr:hypothetical protein [Sphingomonas sp. So64.6b]QNA82815.1 hypothetical protein G4G27_01395 [Sphingomonas sp. So64.6b]